MSDATSGAADLVRRSLVEIFSQNDQSLREAAIDQLVNPSIVFEDNDHRVEGIDAFKAHVAELLAGFDGLEFSATSEPASVGDLGRLTWALAPGSAAPVATGMDVGLAVDGRLARLWTFLD